MDDADFEALSELKPIGYCIEIPDALHNKITEHLQFLKRLQDPTYTKQRWALEAVKEKIKAEEETITGFTKAHFLRIDFPEIVNRKIEGKVEELKKSRGSYSKKKWVLEALYEMLDKEKAKIKHLLDNSRASKISSKAISSLGKKLLYTHHE